MGKGNRPVTCSVSSKRLRGKSWYYRDGKYFYNKRTWKTEKVKQTAEKAKADAAGKAESAEKATA